MLKKLLENAKAFESLSLSRMSTSDRVKASREAKELILSINQFYKENKDSQLMEIMKRLTDKKRKIEKRLTGTPVI